MTREAEVAAYMLADVPLMTILTGGVHTEHSAGRDGISRENPSTADAFDASGWLQPCALVVSGIMTSDGGQIRDDAIPVASNIQTLSIWLYEDAGYDNIDAALSRLFTIMQGHRFTRAYRTDFSVPFNRGVEQGLLKGASMARAALTMRHIRGQQ